MLGGSSHRIAYLLHYKASVKWHYSAPLSSISYKFNSKWQHSHSLSVDGQQMSWLNLSGPIDPRRKPLLLKWHSLFNSFRGNLIHSGVCIQNILTNSHKNIAIAVIVYFFKFKTLFPGIDFFSFTSQWVFGFLDSDSLRNTGHRNLKRHRHI